MFEQIERELGFLGVMCLVGPKPAEGGSLGLVLSVSASVYLSPPLTVLISGYGGTTPAGRKIVEVYPELRGQLQQVVLAFGEQAICELYSLVPPQACN